ncbi:hypothetical protein KQI63_13845 [bacterium]|nr:hypothetical protein [bacterium]
MKFTLSIILIVFCAFVLPGISLAYYGVHPDGYTHTLTAYTFSDLPAEAKKCYNLSDPMAKNERVIKLTYSETITINDTIGFTPGLPYYSDNPLSHIVGYRTAFLVKHEGDTNYQYYNSLYALQTSPYVQLTTIGLEYEEPVPALPSPPWDEGQIFSETGTYNVTIYFMAAPFPTGITEIVHVADISGVSNPTADELYNSAISKETIYINIPKPDYTPSDSVSLSFDETSMKEWEKWLPAAPQTNSPLPDSAKITLKFVVHDDDPFEYHRFRATLWHITDYPGRWTNDFEQVRVPLVPPDSIPTWNEKTSFRNPALESSADIRLNIAPGDTTFHYEFIHDSTAGYTCYQIRSNKKFRNDDVINLPIASFDYAAGARLTVGLVPWKDSIPSNWSEYVPASVLPDSSVVITLPRDEEERYWVVPDSIKEYPYDSVRVQFGDRLGDAWEEAYFGSIKECEPYNDYTTHHKDIFPDTTLPAYINSGDGFITFEKYRGIYGILESATDTIVTHRRLHPKVRNIIIAPLMDYLTGSSPLIQNIGTNYGYNTRFYSISFFNNITTYPFITHIIKTVPGYPYYEPNYYRIFNFERISNIRDVIHIGCFINSNSIYMPNKIKNKRIHWIYSYDYQPPFLTTLLSRLGISLDVKEESGLTGFAVPRSPDNIIFSHIYFQNIQEFVEKHMNNPSEGQIKLPLLISSALGHELGHFSGMSHYDESINYSIMDGSLNYPNPQDKFMKRDFEHLLLDKRSYKNKE